MTTHAMTTHADHDHIPFGLWVYIMSDCILFAGLFAAYAVLQAAPAAGPTAAQIIDRPYVFIETVILLTSSFTCGLALVAARAGRAAATWLALSLTFLLGIAFLGLELHEFAGLIAHGQSWKESAFLSSFFTLVGTHGLHIFVGLLWLVGIFIHLAVRGFSRESASSITYFSLFWHFLDIVWICIFSFVYLFGSL